MRAAEQEIDIELEVGGIVTRGVEWGGQLVRHLTLPPGADFTPLFKGLEGDACQCPHWGFVLRGQLTTTDAGGAQETVNADDLFYWPPGHNVRVDDDAELVMFSPQHEHRRVIAHMAERIAGSK